jgi:hypothetical protein
LKLTAKIIKNTKIIKEATVEKCDNAMSFRDILEECLINVCKEIDVSVPMWLKKNTTEFVNFQKTTFTADQFIEKIKFDKLEIRLEI